MITHITSMHEFKPNTLGLKCTSQYNIIRTQNVIKTLENTLWDENTHYMTEVGGSHYSVSRWAGVAVKLCKLDFNWAEVTEEGG